jgi:hypothetical protein
VFRICWRHRWLPGSKNNAERRFRWKGEHGVANVLAERAGAAPPHPIRERREARLRPSDPTVPANAAREGPGGSAAATP